MVQPLRTFSLGRRLPLLKAEDLDSQGNFVFYPMHFEPEVSLQVFGRPFQNQIEANRRLMVLIPIVIIVDLLIIYLNFRHLPLTDVHDTVGVDPEQVTDLLRTRSKEVNFGVVYGGGLLYEESGNGIRVFHYDQRGSVVAACGCC